MQARREREKKKLECETCWTHSGVHLEVYQRNRQVQWVGTNRRLRRWDCWLQHRHFRHTYTSPLDKNEDVTFRFRIQPLISYPPSRIYAAFTVCICFLLICPGASQSSLTQLQYITDLVIPYSAPRSLRSAHLGALAVPRSRYKLRGICALAVSAPTLWNNNPLSVRSAPSTDNFRSRLLSPPPTWLFFDPCLFGHTIVSQYQVHID